MMPQSGSQPMEGAQWMRTDIPKPNTWKCEFTGDPMGLVLMCPETWAPNAFHRAMQRLCFGFKWSRIKP